MHSGLPCGHLISSDTVLKMIASKGSLRKSSQIIKVNSNYISWNAEKCLSRSRPRLHKWHYCIIIYSIMFFTGLSLQVLRERSLSTMWTTKTSSLQPSFNRATEPNSGPGYLSGTLLSMMIFITGRSGWTIGRSRTNPTTWRSTAQTNYCRRSLPWTICFCSVRISLETRSFLSKARLFRKM